MRYIDPRSTIPTDSDLAVPALVCAITGLRPYVLYDLMTRAPVAIRSTPVGGQQLADLADALWVAAVSRPLTPEDSP